MAITLAKEAIPLLFPPLARPCFPEAAELAPDLPALAPVVGSRVRSSVAIVVDWDTIWALRPDASLTAARSWHDEARRYHAALHSLGLAVDSVDAPGTDLSRYAVIVAPTLYVTTDAQAAALASYVRGGGTLVVGPFSGVVDDRERVHPGGPPGPLRDLLGVEVDEHWPLVDAEAQIVQFASGARTTPHDWAEWIEGADDVDVLAHLDGDEPGAGVGVLAHERIDAAEHPFGEAFARAVGDDGRLPDIGRGLEQHLAHRVVGVGQAGVVEVLVDPLADVLQPAEIDDEAVGVGLGAAEGEGDAPVVPVNLRAMPVVQVLAVRERDVVGRLRAGEHGASDSDRSGGEKRKGGRRRFRF